MQDKNSLLQWDFTLFYVYFIVIKTVEKLLYALRMLLSTSVVVDYFVVLKTRKTLSLLGVIYSILNLAKFLQLSCGYNLITLFTF